MKEMSGLIWGGHFFFYKICILLSMGELFVQSQIFDPTAVFEMITYDMTLLLTLQFGHVNKKKMRP